MKDSKIEWTHHTFNPWIGCTRVSPGCVNCYAETLMADRYKKVTWGPTGERKRTSADYWKQPLKWNRQAAAEGIRRRVFCASLADVFEDKADQPAMDKWRYDLFNLIMETPSLDWLLLTKRPENVKPLLQRLPVLKRDNVWDHLWDNERYKLYFPNVWIGTSVENQEYADKRIPELLKIPATVHFLSVEPMLGEVELRKASADPWFIRNYLTYSHRDWVPYQDGEKDPPFKSELHNRVDWVIVGGESGHGARPMHPDWARSIRDQCQAAGVPFFFKQWGEWGITGPVWTFPHEGMTGPWSTDYKNTGKLSYFIGDGVDTRHTKMEKVGKHRAGRLLDGREWNEYPQPEAQPEQSA